MMLAGQEIGWLSSLQISVVGMLVVMTELFLLYLFVRCLSFTAGRGQRQAGAAAEAAAPEEAVTDEELCCLVAAVAEESGFLPEQIRFTGIERIT